MERYVYIYIFKMFVFACLKFIFIPLKNLISYWHVTINGNNLISYRHVTINGKGLQILTYAQHLQPLSSEG